MRKLAVLGGGHGARTMAADLTLAGHSVTLYEMPEFKNDMRVIFETKRIRLEGKARQVGGGKQTRKVSTTANASRAATQKSPR